jgi:magnesium transporter
MTIEYIKKTKELKEIEFLNSYKKDCLVNVVNPTKEEITFLVNKFNIEIENIEDALDENELPRIEFEKNHTYIYLRHIELENSFPILFVICKDEVIIICKHKLDFIEKIFKLNNKIYTNHKLRILISILDIFSQNLEKVVKQILKLVSNEKIQKNKFGDEDLLTFLKYEDTLNHIISVYNYIDNVYSRMLKKLKFHSDDKEILEDLVVDLEEGLFICKNSKKTITSMRDIHSIRITNKLNNSIKILTSFTIFINIPTVFFSLYGMNITLPFANSNFIFSSIIFLVFSLIILFYFYLRKKEIL